MWKKIFNLFTLSLAISCLSPPLFAVEWDPRLLEASRLAYAAQIAEAEATIQAYIKDHPEDPNGLMVQGVILDWKASLTGQNSEPAQKGLLEIYKKANNLAFHRWEKDPKNVDLLIDLGNSYLFLGRKYADNGDGFRAVLTAKKCQKHLEAALERDPNRVDGLLALGGFHYLADNTPGYLSIFKKLLGIKGNKAQGLEELNKSLTVKHPYYYDTQYALMFLYKDHEKNFPEALKRIDQLEQQFPENPELQFRRAEVWEAQSKSKGITGFLKVAEWCQTAGHTCIPNQLFLAYYQAGIVSVELGQNGPAREYLTLAQKNDPHLDEDRSARVLWFLGKLDQADRQFQQALEKFRQAEEIPGLSKDQKKKIEKSIEALCKAEKLSTGC